MHPHLHWLSKQGNVPGLVGPPGTGGIPTRGPNERHNNVGNQPEVDDIL